jgi:hypothetical protein
MRAIAEATRSLEVPPLLLLGFLLCSAAAAGEPEGPGEAATTADSVASGRIPLYDEYGEIEIWKLPALAEEDTFGVHVRYELRRVEIQAKRLTLRDILKRAQDGERRRREAVEDLTYTEQARVTLIGGRNPLAGDKRRFFEQRSRVYWKRPDQELRVEIAEREYGDQDEEEKALLQARVGIGGGDALDFAQAPFYLEDLDSYRYEIHDRRLFPDRIVYEVAFEPRSEFDVLPHGTFWLDASDFVVVHEEMAFKKNPAPLILKSVDHIVRERRRIGDHWAVTRLQVVAELRLSIVFGFQKLEAEIVYTDFAFNAGLDDSIFERNE